MHKIRDNDLVFIKEHLTLELLNMQNNYHISLLQYAVIYGKKNIVEFLFEHNDLNYNILNDKSWNVLHNAGFLAFDEVHFDLYQYLLEKQVNPHIKNIDGLYPFQIRYNNQELCQKLWQVTKPYWKLEILPEYETGICNVIQQSNNSTDGTLNEQNNESLNELFNGSFFDLLEDNNKKLVMLFCGQGSQKVGMLAEYKNDSDTITLNKIASKILGYDLLDICINGSQEKLDRTDISQPALLLASVVQFRKTLKKPYVCAGFSLGEYSALVVSEAISFEDCIKLLKIRGEAMIEASQNIPSGMLSVIGLDDNMIRDICTKCDVEIANYLFPKGRVLSGEIDNIKKANEMATNRGALKTIVLPVSGGFHSSCMEEAQNKLIDALNKIKINKPKCKLYSNVTGLEYNTIDEIRQLLGEQITRSVQWEQLMNNIIKLNVDEYMEIGIGNQLKTIIKKINMAEWSKFV